MKAIQGQKCYYCSTDNYYYPVDNRDREIIVVNCCQCGRKNLVPGWEVSYTSEEEAKLEGVSTIGSTRPPEITREIKKQVEDVKQTEKIGRWIKTMDLMWIDSVLHQRHVEASTGRDKWEKVASNR